MSNKKRIFKLLLISLIFANIAFIFVQSMLPREVSSAESGAVGEIIEEIIPPETKPGAFIQDNLRKLAHFIEFASLGALVSAYVFFFERRPRVIFGAVFFGGGCAFIDESIQMFSGRGASILDVWIDLSGFLFTSVIFYTVAYSVIFILKKTNKIRQNKDKINTVENG